MSGGRVHGVFVKNGVLILDRRRENEAGVEPVDGPRLTAVLYAMNEEIAEVKRHLDATGDTDSVVLHGKDRVRAAMQAALTKYDAEHPDEVAQLPASA